MQSTKTIQIDQQTTEANHDTTLAMLAHLGGILFGFIPSLIIYLIKKDDKSAQFVTNQSKEALNFQITIAIAFVVSALLILILIGILLIWVIWFADIIFCIIAAVRSSNGDNYRYPITLRLIK